MQNTNLSIEEAADLLDRLKNDAIYKGYNERIANAYNMAVPFCIVRESGEKFLEYKQEVKEYVNELEKHRLMYIEQNYPELIVPF